VWLDSRQQPVSLSAAACHIIQIMQTAPRFGDVRQKKAAGIISGRFVFSVTKFLTVRLR
jgi:hypothetical protein